MARIKGLLFDKDGTLFDFHRTWGAWTHGFILDLVNGGDPEPLADAMGYDLGDSRFRRDSIVVAGSVDEWVDVILPHLGHWQRPDLIAHIKAQTAIVRQEPATDLDPLFSGLTAAGLPLGIATNDGEAPVTRQLTDAGLIHHFDFIAGYDSGHGAKPAPGMLLAFAAHIGAPPSEVVMIGDSTHDLHAATAAGMIRVGVLTGMATEDELTPHADAVLPHIGHLPGWLEEREATG